METDKTVSNAEQSPETSRCPYCHDALGDSPRAQCTVCSAKQHLECFYEHKSCSVHGCENAVMSHQGSVFSYAETQAFESYQDFLSFVQETVSINLGRAESQEILQKRGPKFRINYWAILLILLFYPLILTVLGSLFQPKPGSESAVTFVLSSLGLLALAFFSVRVEEPEASSEQQFEEQHARRLQDKLEGKALQIQPFSFWRDVMGQRGFDPLTGTNPGTAELPLLEEEPSQGHPLKDHPQDDPESEQELAFEDPTR